jgi:uroporphyrinogen III methyltransferase/synthase
VTVYLVGAGPGDPGLLTVRGAEVLGRADVVVFDRLVDPAVLALARPGAEFVDVGKEAGAPGVDAVASHAARQEEINALLVERARAGRTVVRLKGGDPFVFGRGAEEAEALDRAGVGWEVVPGLSSAFAVPALAGVPVTHRGLSTAVTVVTGHGGGDPTEGRVDWEALARAGGTLVVLMGVATRAEVARRLLAGGHPPDTPVVAVEWGATPAQRRVRTTLADLGTADVAAPAVIVIGPVAAVELVGADRPLRGWTVVVTRAPGRAGPLTGALSSAGARVLSLPVVDTADPDDGGAALRDAATRVATFDWVAFTSATAVDRFVAPLGDLRVLAGVRLAAVGPATAAALAARQLTADLVPATPTAAGLVDAFPAAPAGGRVLFPRADGAEATLVDGLVAKGWTVHDVVAYRTVAAPPPPAPVTAALGAADAVTFASPSSVAAYRAARGADGELWPVPPVVACLGPRTAEAAREAGLCGVVQAAAPTAEALVAALVAERAVR